ncbi:DUF4430 domain-containing protein [uncultured Anaerococcus sp.]|uniref:DUF4430 domain-containing protein n=1 Tax=Anaerococcus sp. AH8042_DFU013_CI05 TaxID=3385202 RepID=UPI0025E211F4|nr:DUF4430 domain-containing protein [uncultured Anaerococcus sp.]
MKNFKKYFLVFALLTTFTLTSCNNEANKEVPKTETSQEEIAENPQTTNVEIIFYDKVNDKEILKENADLDKDGLQSYLENNHKAKFEDGMMTELEGISQDANKNQYWMYYVNDEMADVGIGDYVPKDGDKIEFRFEQM